MDTLPGYWRKKKILMCYYNLYRTTHTEASEHSYLSNAGALINVLKTNTPHGTRRSAAAPAAAVYSHIWFGQGIIMKQWYTVFLLTEKENIYIGMISSDFAYFLRWTHSKHGNVLRQVAAGPCCWLLCTATDCMLLLSASNSSGCTIPQLPSR